MKETNNRATPEDANKAHIRQYVGTTAEAVVPSEPFGGDR